MKITALLVLKCNPDESDPTILANASDTSHFGYFQRSSVKEFIVFVGRTVAKRTPSGQRQSVKHEGPLFLTVRVPQFSLIPLAVTFVFNCIGVLCAIYDINNFSQFDGSSDHSNLLFKSLAD